MPSKEKSDEKAAKEAGSPSEEAASKADIRRDESGGDKTASETENKIAELEARLAELEGRVNRSEFVPVSSKPMQRSMPKVGQVVFYRQRKNCFAAIIAAVRLDSERKYSVDSPVDLVYVEPTSGRIVGDKKIPQGLKDRHWWRSSEELSCAIGIELGINLSSR